MNPAVDKIKNVKCVKKSCKYVWHVGKLVTGKVICPNCGLVVVI